MPEWQVKFTPESKEDLGKLDEQIKSRVIKKLLWLRDNFSKITPLPLGGRWRGFFKLRVGKWRIIYEVEDSKQRLIIHRIGRRDEVYKL